MLGRSRRQALAPEPERRLGRPADGSGEVFPPRADDRFSTRFGRLGDAFGVTWRPNLLRP